MTPARWFYVVGGLLLLGGGVIFAVANVREALRDEAESPGISALRTLTTAQALFREGDRDRDGTLDYAVSLEELGRAKLIDPTLATGTKRGYVFRIVAAGENTWSATATPGSSKVGDRSFFVDESGVIRFSTKGAPSSASTAIGG